MANLATTDAVLTAFFAGSGVCDLIEAASHVGKTHKAHMTSLQVKHGAGTDFSESDCAKVVEAVRAYFEPKWANVAISDGVITKWMAANNINDKIELAKNIDYQHIRELAALQTKFAANTDFTREDRNKMVRALEAYLNAAI